MFMLVRPSPWKSGSGRIHFFRNASCTDRISTHNITCVPVLTRSSSGCHLCVMLGTPGLSVFLYRFRKLLAESLERGFELSGAIPFLWCRWPAYSTGVSTLCLTLSLNMSVCALTIAANYLGTFFLLLPLPHVILHWGGSLSKASFTTVGELVSASWSQRIRVVIITPPR